MNQILALCQFEIKRVMKNKRSWVIMFLMPIVFALLFGGLTGSQSASKTHLALVDEDHSMLSQEFVQLLSTQEMLAVVAVPEAEAEQALNDKKVAGIVLIPRGYQLAVLQGQKFDLTFRHGPNLTLAPTIIQAMNDIETRQSVRTAAAKQYAQEADGSLDWLPEYDKIVAASNARPAVTIETTAVSRNQSTLTIQGSTRSSIGFSIMFLMMSMVTVTGAILEARKSGTWYRMMTTPARRLQVLLGYLLSFFLIGWIQFGTLMLLTHFLFDVQWGSIPAQIALVSALLFCVTGLGLFIAGIVKTTEQQTAIGSIVIISTCMLGGIYWPLDIVSDPMKKIANFVPQSWAMQGFTELVARGGGMADIVTPIGVLLGFGLVFLTLGLTRVRYE